MTFKSNFIYYTYICIKCEIFYSVVILIADHQAGEKLIFDMYISNHSFSICASEYITLVQSVVHISRIYYIIRAA